jgi:hypothetical protein
VKIPEVPDTRIKIVWSDPHVFIYVDGVEIISWDTTDKSYPLPQQDSIDEAFAYAVKGAEAFLAYYDPDGKFAAEARAEGRTLRKTEAAGTPRLSTDGKHLLYLTPHTYKTVSNKQVHALVLHMLEHCCLRVCDTTDKLLVECLPILKAVEWYADIQYLRKVSAVIGMRVVYEEETSAKPRTPESAELREMKARYDAVITEWEARPK